SRPGVLQHKRACLDLGGFHLGGAGSGRGEGGERKSGGKQRREFCHDIRSMPHERSWRKVLAGAGGLATGPTVAGIWRRLRQSRAAGYKPPCPPPPRLQPTGRRTTAGASTAGRERRDWGERGASMVAL